MASENSIPSTSAKFKAAIQASKGTAATANFVCFTATDSGMPMTWDTVDKGPEHGCAGGSSDDRVTANKSPDRRTSYIVNPSVNMYAYARSLPVLLAGIGFDIASTDVTTHYSHVCTLADRADLAWLTVLHKIGSKTRRSTDTRLASLNMTASPQNGIQFQSEMNGLTLDYAAGTETQIAESTYELLPSAGSISLQLDPDGTPVEIANIGGSTGAFSADVSMANPLDTAQQKLFEVGRADLPPTGLDITGVIRGLDVDWTTYERIYNGAAAATDPSTEVAIASLDLAFQSPENIPGAAVPFSYTISIPYVTVDLDPANFQASGGNAIRWNFNWAMVDQSATPITATVINDVDDYSNITDPAQS